MGWRWDEDRMRGGCYEGGVPTFTCRYKKKQSLPLTPAD